MSGCIVGSGYVELEVLKMSGAGSVGVMLRREILPGEVTLAGSGVYNTSESMGISKVIKR